MVKFEDAIVKVLKMAQAQQQANKVCSLIDEKIKVEIPYQQECLAVVEDYIVNQLGED